MDRFDLDPVAGCTVVSADCTNCYAMEMARRLDAMRVSKLCGLTRRRGELTIWNGVVRQDREVLLIPLRWRKPRNIFVNSMSDLFLEQVAGLRSRMLPNCCCHRWSCDLIHLLGKTKDD